MLWLPPNFNSYFDYQRPRIGHWGYEVEAEAVQRRARPATTSSATRIHVEPNYFISDAFNVYVGVKRERTPDWLVWQQDNLFGSFDASTRRTSTPGFNWIMTNRHELRLKLQAIGLSAELRQAYRVDDRQRRAHR